MITLDEEALLQANFKASLVILREGLPAGEAVTAGAQDLLQATFKSAMVMIRYAVAAVASESQAEYFFRELEQECHRLTPKFRKGNQLSTMLAKNRLAAESTKVVQSASG